MAFIGMDHGTTGISFCIMSDEGEVIDVFKIGREESKKGLVSATEELTRLVDLNELKLMDVTLKCNNQEASHGVFSSVFFLSKCASLHYLIYSR